MKYREIYETGRSALAGAGIAEAALDARLLLEAVCGTDQNELLVHGDREVKEEKRECYVNYIARRKRHEPLQYITGEQEFMGLVFHVDKRVLIPRQDTEILVEEVMRCLHDGMELLDLCTGSGCILLSLLHYSNGCHGVGADISEGALAVAKRNAQSLGEKNAVFVRSDLLNGIEGKFDIIVSNPPYIRSGVIPALMEEVRDFEPVMALDGKEDGLFFYEKIIEQAPEHLCGGGCLFFEIGCDQAKPVAGKMRAAGYREVTVKKDYAGLDRVVFGYYIHESGENRKTSVDGPRAGGQEDV